MSFCIYQDDNLVPLPTTARFEPLPIEILHTWYASKELIADSNLSWKSVVSLSPMSRTTTIDTCQKYILWCMKLSVAKTWMDTGRKKANFETLERAKFWKRSLQLLPLALILKLMSACSVVLNDCYGKRFITIELVGWFRRSCRFAGARSDKRVLQLSRVQGRKALEIKKKKNRKICQFLCSWHNIFLRL